MRIVIDMQGAQSENRFRPIGRYVLCVAQAMVLNRADHEIIIAVSGQFPDTIEPIRAAFDGLLPQKNIRVWYAPGPMRECESGNEWRRQIGERIREAFLASLQPDLVFIPSFYEGFQDDGVISIGVFAQSLKTVVAIDRLDVCPAADSNSSERNRVLRLHRHLERANLILVLAPLTVAEVLQCLDVPQERVKAGLTIDETVANQGDATVAARSLFIAFEELNAAPTQLIPLTLSNHPKLAYVSPLPPGRSGIADYSAELLPELARFYDIDVIVNQPEIATPCIISNYSVRSVGWFLENTDRYERVVYHFGNSHFHEHMFALLANKPGIVVLHDFYLGDIYHYLEVHRARPNAWARALYESHGYGAVIESLKNRNIVDAVRKFPANFGVLAQAQGIIVHSQHAKDLANQWYRGQLATDWVVTPLPRTPSDSSNRAQARQRLGLRPDDFVVCSFGLLGSTKLNHRLLDSWLESLLARDVNCLLIFVGDDNGSEYGVQLRRTIRANRMNKRIRITGWSDIQTYRDYLAAADIAVQLRTQSRGETSAAVLDAMSYALPTIINAHGSMAEIASDAVWMLPDEFQNYQLTEALDSLWKNGEQRSALGRKAKDLIVSCHTPSTCAARYVQAVEQFHARAQNSATALVKVISEIEGYAPTDAECAGLAQSIGHSLPSSNISRQLLVDVSATCRDDLKTGIQRVVRALIQELIQAPPLGYRVEPVYLTDKGGQWHYRYARDWTLRSLGPRAVGMMPDDPVEYLAGDLLLIADLTMVYAIEAERAGLFKKIKMNGVSLHFILYDLIPLQFPQFFPPGAFDFRKWLNALCSVSDGAVCISRAVADDLRIWMGASGLPRMRPMSIDWFHLGSDIENSIPSRGFPGNAKKILAGIAGAPSFLMVGTIEPRKGHLQTIHAFTKLWQQGLDVNLVIVGNEGWMGLPDEMRRTIPEIVESTLTHPEFGKRLLWLKDVSDEYLGRLYAASACLIAASEREGFGLPLIEAAQHAVPIIARDIPVFREIAGKHAFYFTGGAPDDLVHAVTEWLQLHVTDRQPKSVDMPSLTWRQSANQLISRIVDA